MAGSNTEKPTGKAEAKKNLPATSPKKKETAPVDEKHLKKIVEESKQTEKKKVEVKKVKKNSVKVINPSMNASTKYSVAICRFIKRKTIDKAIEDLEAVVLMKKAVPMKGELPHRKGKMMSGRYPVRAAKEFIVLLKTLRGNANNHDVENPIISEAIASKGPTTYAKGGRARKKKTHVKIVAISKKEEKK